MISVSISELRANLLKYLKIAQQGEQVNVTSKGKPLASLSPPVSRSDAAKAKLAKLAESAVIHDVITPTDEPWGAME